MNEDVIEKKGTIIDFLEQLQEEYVISELRAKISKTQKDKKYWASVCDTKRDKIEDISERNMLENIFTDSTEKIRFYEKGIPEFGYPNFTYVNDEQKYGSNGFPGQEEKDFDNWFDLGKQFKFEFEGLNKIGELVEIDNENEEVELKESKTNESYLIPFEKCRRIY